MKTTHPLSTISNFPKPPITKARNKQSTAYYKITTRTSPIDVLIIGAGPAGLSTALGLARLQIKCIVFSSNVFRNQESKHMHGVPTWEHRDPME